MRPWPNHIDARRGARSHRRRRIAIEPLEPRHFLSAGGVGAEMHNAVLPSDVNGNQYVSPIDALIVLNQLESGQSNSSHMTDVDANGRVEPIDALIVTNYLRRQTTNPSENWIVAFRTGPTVGDKLTGESMIGLLESTLGDKIEVNHVYTNAIQGLSVRLTQQQMSIVSSMPSVQSVTRPAVFRPASDTGPTWIGAPGIWDGTETGGLPGTLGEGIVIGVIDSGIDADNVSFAQTGPVDGFTHTNPLGTGTFLGVCDSSNPSFDPTITCNDKLIGVYDYSETTTPNHDTFADHGTHTASTAAGNILDVPFPNLPEAVRISGVAPHANIIAYDVCGSNNLCQEDDVLAALDQAILDGVDVINLSLGDSPEILNSPYTLAFLTAREAGIFVAASAGNSGPEASTIGIPASASWVTSVANTSHNRILTPSLSITGPVPVPPALQDLPHQLGADIVLPGNVGPAPLVDAAIVDPGNADGCTAFPPDVFAGAIALIDRGTCLFADKVSAAETAGAIAVVIANNRPGPLVTMANVSSAGIPSTFVSESDGDAIHAWVAEHPEDSVLVIGDDVFRHVDDAVGDILANSSSRGANPFLDVLSPSLAAPGINVLAAKASDGADEWGLFTGTSMASPHVAGSAALLRSLHPTWTPTELQSALMMTAKPAAELRKENTVTPADTLDVGAGRIDLGKASRAGFVLDETRSQFETLMTRVSSRALNLPGLMNSTLTGATTWTRTIRSTQNQTVSWTPSFQGADGARVRVSPSIVTLAAGETQQIEINLDFVDVPAFDDWMFGEVTFSPNVDLPDLHMPVAARWADNSLGLVIEEDSIVEGGSSATARVFRTSSTSGAISVDLNVDVAGQITNLPTLSIASGESISAAFQIEAIDDAVIEAAHQVNITASSAGLLPGVDAVTVNDNDIPATVVGRHFLYNNSSFDNNDPGATATDDLAIAIDKEALLPGQPAAARHYTSYSRGLNGVVLDIDSLATGALSTSDFVLRVGNSDDLASWTAAPAPAAITVREDVGSPGISRVTLIWPDRAITGQWLEVVVLANQNTGLQQPDRSYYGNAPGDSLNSKVDVFVDGSDFAGARDNPHDFQSPANIEDEFDFNRDRFVDGSDLAIARDSSTNFQTALRLIRPV